MHGAVELFSWGRGVVKIKRGLGALTSGYEEAMRMTLVIVGDYAGTR
jgi:hypothetical protein